jgi:Putative metallopeptidase
MAARRAADARRSEKASGCGLVCIVLAAFLLFGVGPTCAQTAPSASERFQARISEVARSLQNDPQLRKLSQQEREKLAEFVIGNMLFALLHELAHTATDEFDLPVLGREEDAADDFAAVRLLRIGSEFSHRILVEAAKGWFLSELRDQQDGDKPDFADEHSLDAQRAYHIVCLMVGSDRSKFADLANETKLPPERQQTCPRDFEKASRSWERVLKPLQRSADRPKTKIDVIYAEAKGNLDLYAKAFRTVRLLDVVAEHISDELAWPAPFALEMRSCGVINAVWSAADRKLTLCYELAADFAELYREYGTVQAKSRKRKTR